MFCYFGLFFALLIPNHLKNQNFKKMKKSPGDIIILHMCTKNYDHMMYGDMVHNRRRTDRQKKRHPVKVVPSPPRWLPTKGKTF